MRNEQLLRKIEDFPLAEVGGSYTFLHRLCRENGWGRAQGERAITEYKRFLYLAAVSPVPVTPPPAVDQVWHLHLLYTRSYWDGLCRDILGRPLHHGPTAGGAAEDAKFDDWYAITRELYEVEFDTAPPTAIWPTRFNPETRYRWIDSARHWVIPRPGLSGIMPSAAPLLLAGSLGPIWIFALVGFVVWVFRKMIESDQPNLKRRGDSGGDFFSECGTSDSDCGDSGGDCGGGDGGGGCGGGGCGGD